MKHLPWRAHNPASWAQEVAAAELSRLEELALLHLRDAQWSRGWLPASPSLVSGLLEFNGFTKQELKAVRLGHLLEQFFPLAAGDTDRRRDERLHEERERAAEMAQTNSIRGKNAAAARWGKKESDASSNAPGNASSIAPSNAPDARSNTAVSRKPLAVSRSSTTSIPRDAGSGAGRAMGGAERIDRLVQATAQALGYVPPGSQEHQ